METTKVETIMAEIAEVLNKYSIPYNTISVDISLLNEDFEQTFPQLKDYKAGTFYRPLSVNKTPVTFQAKRRIPFEEIVEWLHKNTLPIFEKIAKEIQADFTDVIANVHISDQKGNPTFPNKLSYLIDLSCRHKDEMITKSGNTVSLSVIAQQHSATAYPVIDTYVAWLVDEESGGDFGLQFVAYGTLQKEEIHAGTLELVNQSLVNSLANCIKREAAKLHNPK